MRTAVQTTLKQELFSDNHSLCHGYLRNLDFLLKAMEVVDGFQKDFNYFVSNVFKSIKEHGWICGTPSNIEIPGLMTGLSGIGYNLLRFAYPDIPSVLGLEFFESERKGEGF
ncbi:lanthionine synthetase LanC family protein [Thermoflavimicrobium daqui]|uniref:lanthionine synthetase LanC family protein n=1 Tax=Thermoflavimicrobium daqui TaxID=2137476 RepID=UPI001F0BFB06|nr:lanthionine synthetase LanC family protein [Thermoflavimicrobium daqui]